MLPPRPQTSRWLRLFKVIFRPTDYLDDYSKRYGDIFAVGSEETPFVYVSHPKAIQEIFNADKTLFTSNIRGGFLGTLMGENSLLFLQGEPHQRQRKLLTPPFHGERLQTYSQLICNITQQVTDAWQLGKPFLVRPAMQEITLKVILQAVFGLYSGARYEQLRDLLNEMLESLGSPASALIIFFANLQKDWGAWSPWGHFLRLKSQTDELLYAEIRERREKGDLSGEDILTLLLSARDEQGQGMSDAELRDELMTLLVAGHETTASMLTWALYWIHFFPEIEQKLRLELENTPSSAEIAQLPYLNALCLETLRIYPVALGTFPRILQQPWDLMGYHFEPGTVLSPSIYLVHRREDLYPQPQQFRPERFLEKQFSPYEFLPFGGGSRRCIGMGLALLEMKLVLATILSRFDLQLLNQRPLKPVRRGLTIALPGNFKMVISALR